MAAAGGDAGTAHLLRCSIPIADSYGVVTRRLPGQAAPQTLVACVGSGLRPLLGADARGHLRLGPPLQLYSEPAAGGGGGGGGGSGGAAAPARRAYAGGPFHYPTWDLWSASVYMVQGEAVLRLTADNTVTLVAGSEAAGGEADGAGSAARFLSSSFSAADGRGRLYVADVKRIRQLQLPAAWEVGGAGGLGAAGGAAAAGGEVVVTTLTMRAPTEICGLAFDGSSDGTGSLVYATPTAVYRLPLSGEGAAAPASSVLLAGRKNEPGTPDGRGSSARFNDIVGLALDGEGRAYVADQRNGGRTTVLRRVTHDGVVTTVAAAELEERCSRPAVLPNGCLVLCSNTHLHVLDLGLRLSPGHAGLPPPPPQPAGLPPRTLAGDWGAVLDRQPDGSSDLTVVAGDCPFHVHRLVLCTRSDYYARCLGSDFAEGAAEQPQQVLNLPDVDPEVFKLALRFMYTGAVDVPPALAQGVAELADRLLLPELCAAAQAVVEASVTAGSVVGALLWADAAGPSFSALLGRLKAWYVEHHEEVLEAEPGAIVRIAAHSPELVGEVMQACLRAAKRVSMR